MTADVSVLPGALFSIFVVSRCWRHTALYGVFKVRFMLALSTIRAYQRTAESQ